MRQAIIVESDTHGGSKFGLMNPNIKLTSLDVVGYKDGDPIYDESTYTPATSASQIALWQLRTENIGKVKSIIGNYDKAVYIHSGDLTQGIKYPAALVTTRVADQVVIATDNLAQIAEISEIQTLRLATGTEAHNLGQGSTDDLITRHLVKSYPDKDVKLRNHGRGVMDDGFTVDYAHHGAHPGSRSWLSGNVARFYLRDIMMQCVAAGKKPPDLVVRGHYHRFIWETVRYNGFTSHIVIAPPMCMADDHTLQAVASPQTQTCGMLVADIVDGRLFDIYAYTRDYDLVAEEQL